MKILVLGSNGMLGNYITQYLNKCDMNIVKIDRNILDACQTNIQDIYHILRNYQSKNVIVINCIGMIPQRNSMDNIRKYIQVNTLFPHLLASVCETLNYKLIHISTDCVFSGSKGNYSEDDEHDETNIYGTTKSLGEPINCCVIRTSIIGEEQQNKKSLLEWVKNNDGKTINGFTKHYWNGITCLQLAKIIHLIISNNIYWNGVRHIYSPDIISKYELITMIKEIYHLNILINPVETDLIDKTLTTKFEMITNIPNIKIQLEELQKFNFS